MNELRLLFSSGKDSAYTARLENNWSGPASEPVVFTPFLDDQDYDDLRWYLEEYMDLPDGGSVVRAQRIETRLYEWGRKLHDALFPAGPNKSLLQQLLARPEPRLFTIGTADPRLLRLPWELIA